LCGSTLTVERAPGALANYADDLVLRLVEETSSSAANYAGLEGQTSSKHAVTPFSGGSDHCLLVDPSVGVPCPMLNQWPDKFYHTSADTLDKVDPAMLARVGTIAATYAYFLAKTGSQEATWLAEELLSRLKTGVLETLRDEVAHSHDNEDARKRNQPLARRVDFLIQRSERALASLRRLAEIDVSPWQKEARRFAEAELARVEKLVSEPQTEPPDDRWEREAASLVVRRLCPGPLDPKNFINKMSDEVYETWWGVYKKDPEGTYAYPAMLLYWADGRRNVREISDLIELETGKRVTELLVTCCQLWERLGLVELSPRV